MTTVGFVGLGNMGGRMVQHLVGAGHEVAVHDVGDAAVARAVDTGARVAGSVGAVADGADVVFLSLPTPDVVESVVTELLTKADPGLVIVDHSTIDPGTTRALADLASGVGVAFVDAPVSGGVQGADAGTLAVMTGGEPEALDRVRPYLELYAGRVFHIGGVGSGQTIKLVNNQVTASIIVALGEGLSTAVAAGVDLDVAASVLGAGSANSNVLSGYFPRTLFTEDRPTGFALDFMHKDLGLFLEAADHVGLPVPLTSLVRDLFRIGQRDGRGASDFTSVVEFYEDFTGIRLQTTWGAQ